MPSKGGPRELPLQAIRRVLFIHKGVALPAEEPDRAWALETDDEVFLVPESAGAQAGLRQAVAIHPPLADRFYTVRYSEAPVSWGVLRWHWTLLREGWGVFKPETLSRILSRADVAGPMSWAQLKAGEEP